MQLPILNIVLCWFLLFQVFPIATEYADRLMEYLKKQNLKESINMKE